MLGVEQQLKEAYVKSGLVRMVFNPVLNHGDRSYVTHQAAECAGEQGRFWEFREFLFSHQDRLWSGDVRAVVKTLATEAALNGDAFNLCLDEERYYERVDQQDALRRANGIRSQPSFSFNGDIRVGSAPFETFAQLLDEKLTAAE